MKLMAVLVFAILAGCTGEPAPAAPHTPGPGPLDAAELAAHSLGVASLAGMRLLSTPHGRQVLSRVMSCALPRGASITAITRTGMPYSFAGDAGLAPAWARRPATRHEHELVTACVQTRTPGMTRV
jgi:hypothetical protein